jgi:hypothetical protein
MWSRVMVFIILCIVALIDFCECKNAQDAQQKTLFQAKAVLLGIAGGLVI